MLPSPRDRLSPFTFPPTKHMPGMCQVWARPGRQKAALFHQHHASLSVHNAERATPSIHIGKGVIQAPKCGSKAFRVKRGSGFQRRQKLGGVR